jgi:hypothetical protein
LTASLADQAQIVGKQDYREGGDTSRGLSQSGSTSNIHVNTSRSFRGGEMKVAFRDTQELGVIQASPSPKKNK